MRNGTVKGRAQNPTSLDSNTAMTGASPARKGSNKRKAVHSTAPSNNATPYGLSQSAANQRTSMHALNPVNSSRSQSKQGSSRKISSIKHKPKKGALMPQKIQLTSQITS